MRVVAIVFGSMFVLAGILAALAGNSGIDSGDTNDWRCTSVPQSANEVQQDCAWRGDDPAVVAAKNAEGLSTIVAGAGLFIGGCALLGGATAASGRAPQTRLPYAPQPVAAGFPPGYGAASAPPPPSGWPGGPAGEPPRS